MSDVNEYIPTDQDDPVAGPTWIVGALGVILLIVIVLGLVAIYKDAQRAADEVEVINRVPVEFETLQAEQEARLAAAHYDQFDDEIALVIPIEQAMEIIAEEYGDAGR